jgi:hypothetical protein
MTPFGTARQDSSRRISLEGRPMRTLRHPRWAYTALALTVSIFLLENPRLRAQEKVPTKATKSALPAALAMTRTRGAATVAVVTSSDQPASVRFWNEFYDGAWARFNRGIVQVVNVSKDSDPGLVRTMGVNRFPSVIVYTRGPQGIGQLTTIADCDTAESLTARLRALDLGLEPSGKADPAVSATSFGGDVYPSNQFSPPQPQCNPPVTSSPPQNQPPAVSMTPSFQPTVTATANLIQVPSQSLMIQQAPPQVFLAPNQAPVVYVPQMMSTAAAVPPMVASAPPSNLFMAAPSVAAAPAPQPTMAVAAAPTLTAAAAPAAATAVMAVAAGPQPLTAVSNSTLSLPSSGNRTRVRVRGPGFMGSSLARLGERLTQFGRARIETIQETTLEPPPPQSAAGGMTSISTTTSTPVSQGPTTSTVLVPGQQPPPEVGKPPCPPSQPSCPLPSPQATTHKLL